METCWEDGNKLVRDNRDKEAIETWFYGANQCIDCRHSLFLTGIKYYDDGSLTKAYDLFIRCISNHDCKHSREMLEAVDSRIKGEKE
jgi:hypothetical protein